MDANTRTLGFSSMRMGFQWSALTVDIVPDLSQLDIAAKMMVWCNKAYQTAHNYPLEYRWGSLLYTPTAG